MITLEECAELVALTFQSAPPDLLAMIEAEKLKMKEENDEPENDHNNQA